MKGTDFFALPEGTVVLLRNRSREARVNRGLELVTLGSTRRFDYAFDVRPSETGAYRAGAHLASLMWHHEDASDEFWDDWGRGTKKMVSARDVVGVWEDIREDVLADRRRQFDEDRAQEAAEAAEREQMHEAQATLVPLMDAVGLSPDHVARTGRHPAHAPVFTLEQVAKMIEAAQSTGPSTALGASTAE